MQGRIKQVQVNDGGKWVDINPTATYGLATNNFVRSGGDGYKVFSKNGMEAYDFGPGVEDVVIGYLQSHAPYKAYTDGRIIEGKTFDAMMMKKDDAAMKQPATTTTMAKTETMAGDYMVKAGDTLWTIAKAHYGDAVLWKKIEDANGVENVRNLKVGQMLKLPK